MTWSTKVACAQWNSSRIHRVVRRPSLSMVPADVAMEAGPCGPSRADRRCRRLLAMGGTVRSARPLKSEITRCSSTPRLASCSMQFSVPATRWNPRICRFVAVVLPHQRVRPERLDLVRHGGGHRHRPRLADAFLETGRSRSAWPHPGRTVSGCGAVSDGHRRVTPSLELSTPELLESSEFVSLMLKIAREQQHDQPRIRPQRCADGESTAAGRPGTTHRCNRHLAAGPAERSRSAAAVWRPRFWPPLRRRRPRRQSQTRQTRSPSSLHAEAELDERSNGLVYRDGQYHLSTNTIRQGPGWANMSWGMRSAPICAPGANFRSPSVATVT